MKEVVNMKSKNPVRGMRYRAVSSKLVISGILWISALSCLAERTCFLVQGDAATAVEKNAILDFYNDLVNMVDGDVILLSESNAVPSAASKEEIETQGKGSTLSEDDF